MAGGMKKGAGEDPFADDPEPDSSPDVNRTEPTETDSEPATSTSETGSSNSSQTPMKLPYKYRRSGVRDGRERVPLFIQDSTKEAERNTMSTLEERFGENVAKTDLREASLQAGMENIEAVASQLEEWGYGLEFDE